MGSDKATLPFGGEPMLVRVVRLLAEVVEPIVVVRAAGQQLPELPAGVIIAQDRRASRGPLEGLQAGLLAGGRGADAYYATSCDVPLLVPAFVRRMIELWRGHDVAVAVEGRFHHPLAAVYAARVASEIRLLLDEDRLRPVFLFDRVDTRRVEVDALREVDPELHSLMNLNRHEDYLAALALAGFDPPPREP